MNDIKEKSDEERIMSDYAKEILNNICVNKRVDITEKNLKRIKIIVAADDTLDGLKDKDQVSVIINQAIEHYFKSADVQNTILDL